MVKDFSYIDELTHEELKKEYKNVCKELSSLSKEFCIVSREKDVWKDTLEDIDYHLIGHLGDGIQEEVDEKVNRCKEKVKKLEELVNE